MDPASPGGESRRVEHCRESQRQHDWADAQKNALKPHLKQQWVIAPEASAGFVANMEDVLEVYQRPRDPQRPVVCLDETSKQMIVETRAPIPAAPGRTARHDYEYERNGVANLFMMFAPLEGWRHVKVTDRHAAIDYAHALKDLSDTHFPGAAKIVLVQDNLSTHTPASLYAAFPAVDTASENRTTGYKSAGLQKVALAGNDRLERIFRRHPGVKRTLRSLYYRVNGRAAQEEIPQSVRDDLASRFVEPNTRLAALLREHGLTVPGWLNDQVPTGTDAGPGAGSGASA